MRYFAYLVLAAQAASRAGWDPPAAGQPAGEGIITAPGLSEERAGAWRRWAAASVALGPTTFDRVTDVPSDQVRRIGGHRPAHAV